MITFEKEFEEQFSKVFDNAGKIKACGREECIKLIHKAKACNDMCRFGDLKTGMLEPGNLRHLHFMITGEKFG